MVQDTGVDAYAALGADINKRRTDGTQETTEGIVSEKLPELTLDMKDEDIVKLTDKWERDWRDSAKKQEWETQIKDNEEYWLGKQFDLPKADKSRPMVDNAIFESLETFLPQATRRNPEPLVELAAEETSAGAPPDPVKLAYVDKVKARLRDIAGENKNAVRLKLKKGARHWAIFQLGVAKFGWDLDKDIPSVRIIRPKRILLDPDASVDEDGYTGNRIGEYRKLEASKLLKIIGDGKETSEAKKAITDLVKEDTGTDVQFVEWWTPQYFCWKLGKSILLKKKNPHWNYDRQAISESVDTYGNVAPATEEVRGINHLPSPQMPYEFL